MPDAVKTLTDDERLKQIRDKQRYRAEWAYGDDIKFLLNQNTALREQLAQTSEARDQLSAALSVRDAQLAQVTAERDRAKEDLRILTQGRFIQS